ncbi:MAG: hypothetical protein ACQUHE_13465 [Bacteroidia bacterium]
MKNPSLLSLVFRVTKLTAKITKQLKTRSEDPALEAKWNEVLDLTRKLLPFVRSKMEEEKRKRGTTAARNPASDLR